MIIIFTTLPLLILVLTALCIRLDRNIGAVEDRILITLLHNGPLSRRSLSDFMATSSRYFEDALENLCLGEELYSTVEQDVYQDFYNIKFSLSCTGKARAEQLARKDEALDFCPVCDENGLRRAWYSDHYAKYWECRNCGAKVKNCPKCQTLLFDEDPFHSNWHCLHHNRSNFSLWGSE